MPFLRDLEGDYWLEAETPNRVSVLIRPLLGWVYDADLFIGVYESSLGVSAFFVRVLDESAQQKSSSNDKEPWGALYEETPESSGSMKGLMGYTPDIKLHKLQCVSCSVSYFDEAMFSASGWLEKYADYKRIHFLRMRNKKRLTALMEFFDFQSQINLPASFSLVELRAGGDTCCDQGSFEGLENAEGYCLLGSDKEKRDDWYMIASPDGFNLRAQTQTLQSFSKEGTLTRGILSVLGDATGIRHKTPLLPLSPWGAGGESYYCWQGLKESSGPFLTPLYKRLFECCIPSREPVLALRKPTDLKNRRFSHFRREDSVYYLSRYQNQRLVGTHFLLAHGRRTGGLVSGEDVSKVASWFNWYVEKGMVGTADCLILNGMSRESLEEECCVYNLIGEL